MSTKNSDLIANLEAVPQVANDVQELHARVRVALGSVALLTTDIEAADILMLAPIPSNAVITSLKIANDDLDTATTITMDIGVYQSDGTAVDADCYVTASTQLRAAAAFTDLRWETLDINTLGQKVWEDAGASADPVEDYYIGASFPAAGTTAGDISFIIEYVVD